MLMDFGWIWVFLWEFFAGANEWMFMDLIGSDGL